MNFPFCKIWLAALAAGCCASAAQAQSNVTIYGLLDAGTTWTNDLKSAGGKDGYSVDTGVAQASRLGFRGTEDLGGGLKADFVLESGINLDTGTLGQGGLIFGRRASVGLSGGFGSLSAGRMFDMLGDVFPAYALAANTPAGLMAWALPMYSAGGAALNNRASGSAVNNSLKYLAPRLGGFSLGLTYSLGEVPGSSSANSAYSSALSYDGGAFKASVGGYVQRNASATLGNLTVLAIGAAYQWDQTRLFGMVSDASFGAGSQPSALTTELGMSYQWRPQWVLGGGVQVQQRNNGLRHADQLTLSADYLLSKRTDVYLSIANGRDHAFGAQVLAALGGVSSTTAQTGVRLGVRSRF